MPYITINGIPTWVNWMTYVQNITNSSDPINTLNTSVSSALPWFFPMIPFVLYLLLFILFQDSPSRFKFPVIAALGLVISVFMAAFGLIPDAIVNVVLFIVAYVLSFIFKM